MLGGTLKFWICHFFASNTYLSYSMLGVFTWSLQSGWIIFANAWKLWHSQSNTLMKLLSALHGWPPKQKLWKETSYKRVAAVARGGLGLLFLADSSWCLASSLMQHKKALLHSSVHPAWNRHCSYILATWVTFMTERGLLPIILPFLAKLPLFLLILLELRTRLLLYQVLLLPFFSALCQCNAGAWTQGYISQNRPVWLC